MGRVKDIVTGCNIAGGEGIVEETTIGLFVVTNEDRLDGLGVESVVGIAGKDLFHMGDTEERDEFSPIRFGAIDFEVWSGCFAVVEADWHVVCYLDGILDCEEPELHWEVVFGEVVACNVADVFPVGFGKAVLILAFTWGAGCDGKVFIKEFFDNATDEFEVSIS